MKSRHTLIPALGLALVTLVVAGCSKGGGGSSGGSSSSSSSSSSSGGSGSPTGGSNGGTAPGGGGGTGGGGTSAAGPPAPDLGYAYHTAVLAYYYFYHKKDTIIWGDVGSQWGHYDQDDYSTVLDDGYGASFPDFEEATLFGSFYSYYEPPPVPEPGIPPHDTTPFGDPDGIITYEDMMIDANACYTELLDPSGVTATYTGTFIGTHPGPDYSLGTGDDIPVYEQELAGLDPVPGKYHFNSDAVLNGTLTLNGGPLDVWIFQIEGNLRVKGASKVIMTGGAVAQNVWWQVGVEATYGQYVSYDSSTGHYIYNFIPGAYIGDDPSYPPYNDPAKTGYASFAGNVFCWGDIAVARGSNLTGRAFSMYYGWWHYAAVIYGTVSINATQPLSLMGTANDFALLARGSITNVGETAIKGKVGVSTGSSPPRPSTLPDLFEVEPAEFWLADSDPASDTAVTSAIAAIGEANTRDVDYNLAGVKLQGKNLPPGVYLIDSSAFTGTSTDGPVVLNGLNDPTSTWIFRSSTALTVTTASGVLQFIYQNGANPDNVYWICPSFYLAPSVSIRGTVLTSSTSSSSINLDSDSTLQGRAVTTGVGGGISLHANTVFSDSNGGLLAWVEQSDAEPATDDEAVSVANDGTSLYIFGFKNGSGAGSDSHWRLEKRVLATGDLDLTFGSGTGIREWNPGTGNDIPRRIRIDATHMYLLGSQEDPPGSGTYKWRLEKRSLATGLPDGTFGSGGPVFSTLTYGGVAADMELHAGSLYIVGDQNDVAPFAATRIRYERRLASSGDFDTATGSGFFSPAYYSVPSWVEPPDPIPPGYYVPGAAGLTRIAPGLWDPPYTGDPADVLVRAATPIGVLVDDSIYDRGARCITLVPVPADLGGLLTYKSAPFMIVGGWHGSGIVSGLCQKRYLSDGALDVGDGLVVPPYPGYGTGSADGSQLITWAGYRNVVQSIVNDGSHSFALLSADYIGAVYPGFASIPFMSYWVVEKRSMIGYVPSTYPADTPVTGGSPAAEPHYALGIYGPPPYAEYESDFSCGSLAIDSLAKRFFIAGCNTGHLGGELWRIEKRKDSTLVLDPLFNTSGSRPGMIEVDPEPGQEEVLEQWYVYSYVTPTGWRWTSESPIGDPDVYWSGSPSDHRPGVPAVAGRPDRCRAVTISADKIYIVGSDASDPSHLGQWRVECRNR